MRTLGPVGFSLLCAVSTGISLIPFVGASEEPAPAPIEPLSIDQVTLLAAFGLLSFVAIGGALFRAFTPPPPPFVVEYISPKIDPEELRNL